MNESQKFLEIINIVHELFEMDQKYCVDCLFDMYYQMKKKAKIDKVAKYNKNDVKKIWGALDYCKKIPQHYGKSQIVKIAGNKYDIDPNLLSSLIASFHATQGVKNKRFKKLYPEILE